jgi:excisionase family DNA binding protein
MNREDSGCVPKNLSKPLVVSPRQACQLLSVGLTRLYELLNEGKLDSFMVGRSRRITVVSIHGFIEPHRATASERPAPIGNGRSGPEGPRSAMTSFEATFADTAASMSKVIEAATDSVMQAVAREMTHLGYKANAGHGGELREAVYAVISRNVIEATVQKMNEKVARNPSYR